jgi:hypothetical protein
MAAPLVQHQALQRGTSMRSLSYIFLWFVAAIEQSQWRTNHDAMIHHDSFHHSCPQCMKMCGSAPAWKVKYPQKWHCASVSVIGGSQHPIKHPMMTYAESWCITTMYTYSAYCKYLHIMGSPGPVCFNANSYIHVHIYDHNIHDIYII